MFLFLGLGVPISIALGGLSGILVYIFRGPGAISMLVLKSFGMTSSFEFIAVPLFVFMANMLERSGIAEDLYETMNRFVGGSAGGLAAGTVIICTIFAAMAGISGAATVSMGIPALPAMMARGYSTRLALGAAAAGGSLGILIPPSVTMIIYGVAAQTSIGKLYAGGVLPGLLLSALFIAYILVRAHFQPHIAPPRPATERYTRRHRRGRPLSRNDRVRVGPAVPRAREGTEINDSRVAMVCEKEGITASEARGRMAAATSLERLGRPEEIGALVAFLASDAAGFITGAAIPIDGGVQNGL